MVDLLVFVVVVEEEHLEKFRIELIEDFLAYFVALHGFSLEDCHVFFHVFDHLLQFLFFTLFLIHE